MLKNVILHARYPYTAGIIAIIWVGTAILLAFDSSAKVLNMLTFNVVATTLIAVIGFSNPRK